MRSETSEVREKLMLNSCKYGICYLFHCTADKALQTFTFVSLHFLNVHHGLLKHFLKCVRLDFSNATATHVAASYIFS